MLAKTTLDAEQVRRALQASERIAQREGPYAAQLAGPATWHAITVAPNCDRIAAGHLVGRRFGVYLPETVSERYAVGPASKRKDVREPLLPGYVFLFVWGIADHAERILGCPGVIDFLRYGLSREIAIIPDAIMDDIREIENRMLPTVTAYGGCSMAGGSSKKKKKRWRNRRKPKEIKDDGGDVIAVYPYSPMLGDLEPLDRAERIRTFLASLSLGS